MCVFVFLRTEAKRTQENLFSRALFADEARSDAVDVVLDAEADVLQVLVGERRQVRHDAYRKLPGSFRAGSRKAAAPARRRRARQVHSLPLSDGRGVEHLARDAPVRPHLLHPQRDQPVVEQHHEPRRDL